MMLEPVFNWTGDPDDEMFCAYAGYSAHVECMGGPDPDEPDDDGREYWYAGVYRPIRHGQSDYCLFHSGDADVLPLSCVAARRLCELAILADLYQSHQVTMDRLCKDWEGALRKLAE